MTIEDSATRRPSIERHLRDVIRPAIYPDRTPLRVDAHHVRGEPVSFAEATQQAFSPFAVGEPWGGQWDTSWFRLTGRVPESWTGREVTALVTLGGGAGMIGFSAEGQVWSAAGVPLHGLHFKHREHVVSARAVGGDHVEFYVEAAANPIPPWELADWPLLMPDYDGSPLFALEQAELATADRQVEALFFDVRLLLQMAQFIPDRSEAILAALTDVATLLDADDVSSTAAAARAALAARVEGAVHFGAHGHRRRARPHRLGLALADPRDAAQVRPHVLEPAAADGGVRGTPLRLQPGPAVPVDQRRLPGPVRADQGARRRGALGAGRRHVGRG